ncbi:MAG: DUF4012 domain-containing protein [Anaerolineaceae bacterium]|nr:DUF4012 domain-containing protein [Anaerolineaceae bacterium]
MPIFRKNATPQPAPPRSPAAKWLRRAGLLLLALLLLWLGFITWQGVALMQNAKAGLSMAQSGLDGLDPQQALTTLAQTEQHLVSLRGGLTPLMPVVNLAARLPGKVGRYASQADPGLDYAIEMVRTARQTLQGLLPAWETLNDPSTGDAPATSRLTAALVEGSAYFYGAQTSLGQAAALREKIDGSLLPEPWDSRYQQLDENFEQLEAGLDALIALPELAGEPEERTYLLAAMNDDELRGTGGFISGLGLLRVKDGDIIHLTMVDSYILDNPVAEYPEAPGALKEFMTLGMWLPRDANWSPDFPQSARDLQNLYTLTTGQAVDGVIAFDTQAASLFVDVLGPLPLPGAPEPVNASIVQAWMRTAWGPEAGEDMTNDWWLGRKDFMLDLAQAAVDRVQTLEDRQSLVDLAWVAHETLQTGHLFLYFNHDTGQGALERAGLDNGVHPGPGDFLMIVDSNIGFNKVNARVTSQATYTVDLSDPAQPKASLEVTYKNPSQTPDGCTHQAVYGEDYADMQNRCYWNAWRVLAAGGSRLEDSTAQTVPAELILNGSGWDGMVRSEQGPNATAQFSGMMVLPGQAEQTYRLDWSLPTRVAYRTDNGWIYTLKLQKQGSAAALPVTVQIQAPPGTTLSAEGWTEQGAGLWQWQGTVNEPLNFELSFEATR